MIETLTFIGSLLAQCITLIALFYVSYTICQRCFHVTSLIVRLCAICILFCWLHSILFSVLMSLQLFAPLPATVTALICLILTRTLSPQKHKADCKSLTDAITFLKQQFADINNDAAWLIMLTTFALLLALLTIRTLSLPILGWDFLTYHGLKAGLWVQTKEWTTFNAPGGWEYYRSFFGGGEVFTAWAMVFTHSDLFAGLPDIFFYLLLGLITICIANEFDVNVKTAVGVAIAFLCSPMISRMVGSGYVDTCASTFLLSGLLFLLRFTRSRQQADLCFTALSFGLASSVKVNMLFTSILMAIPIVVLLIIYRWSSIKGLLFSLFGFAIPIVPWLLFNYIITGYPLGCVPLRVGSIQLGVSPPNLTYQLDRLYQNPYVFSSEIRSIINTLRPYGFSLILSAIGIVGIFRGLLRGQIRYILTFILMLFVAGLYFSPQFTVVRLGWSNTNARFLIPVLFLNAAAGVFFLQRFRYGTTLIVSLSVISTILGFEYFLKTYVLGKHAIELCFLIAAAFIVLLVYCLVNKIELIFRLKRTIVIVSCAIAFTLCMIICGTFKDWFRIRAYSECTTFHSFPNYWVEGLQALESESPPITIAFAYGPLQISQKAFLAPFLGGHLKNRLVYVSPERDGSILPHHPDYLAKSDPDFDQWIYRLRDAGTTHILCLQPICKEFEWIQEHPNLFTRLVSQSQDWGLFRIEWAMNEL